MKFLLALVLVLMPFMTSAKQTPSFNAVDTDNTIKSQAWFTQAYASGVRLFIVDGSMWGAPCRPNPVMANELQLALNAGLKIGMYTRNPNCWPQGLQAAGATLSHLQFFAIDEETASDGVPASAPVSAAMVSGITAEGVRPIIYSWDGAYQKLNKSTTYSYLPLWDASQPFTPYSGWTSDVGEQQTYNYKMDGVLVDLDSFNLNFLNPAK